MKYILSLSLIFITSPLFATIEKTVSVSGECLRKVAPDRGSINLIAEFTDKDVVIATKKAQSLYEKVRAEVKKMDLKDAEFETSIYSVNEEFEWINNKNQSKGFKASMGFEVTTSDIQKLGDILAKTSPLGIQRVNNFNFFLSDKKRQEIHEACLAEAILNAKSKAQKMAEAASAKIGSILTIAETSNPPPPIHYAMRADPALVRDKEISSASIETKSQSITVSINAVFSLQ